MGVAPVNQSEKNRQYLHNKLHSHLKSGAVRAKTVTRKGRTATIQVTDFATASGATIADAFPALPVDGGTYTDLSARSPLTDISSDDINQWVLADCYFLAVLIELAEFHKDYIKQLLQPEVDAGNRPIPGKWVVYFTRAGVWTRVHVSCMVGSVQSQPGADGDYWPDLFEVAYAFFRTGADTFASLNYGYQGTVFGDFGISLAAAARTVAGQMAIIKAGCMPTLSTQSSNNPPGTVAGHVYGAIAAQPDLNLPVPTKIRYRNPWGVASNLWYDLTDADIPKYFPSGYLIVGAPPTAQVPAVPVPRITPVPVPPPPTIPLAVPPTAPTGLKCSRVTKNSVTLRWVNTATDATEVRVYRQGKGSMEWVAVAPQLAPITCLFTDSGLAKRATYAYKVSAYNPSGETFSVLVTVVTPTH